MSSQTNNFEKFVIKQIVGSVEYNPETDEYKINNIHVSDDLINKIVEEGERYGFSREESVRYISLIANNIKTSPSVDIINSSISVENLNHGIHLKINIVHQTKGKRYLDLITLGENSFYVVGTNISGLKCGDKLKPLDRDWYVSYHIDFQIFRRKNRIPDANTILHIGKLESIEIFTPSIINEILDSRNTFSFTEQNKLTEETLEESTNTDSSKNRIGLSVNKLITAIKKSVKSETIEKDYNTLLNICLDLNTSSYILNLFIIAEKTIVSKDSENIPFDDFFLLETKPRSTEIEENEINPLTDIEQDEISVLPHVTEPQCRQEVKNERIPPVELGNVDNNVVDNRRMFKRPFNFFKGRIRRLEYWLSYFIFNVYYSFIIVISQSAEGFLFLLIPGYWFILAQGSKRCHDRGNSGWYQLIPFYGFWMAFAGSEEGENEYGNNPKG